MAKNKTRASRKKKTWKEMSPGRKVGTILTAIVQVSLLVAAQRDISHRPADQINGPKAAWRAASFVNFIGPMGYFIFGRKHSAAGK
ncbi:PLD nuclease N-terminal domain-containing protein [Arthrobacter sp. FW306-05-C]|uniref:PLD nuclease N-terminal domain-containing protein n=1 Tax=unclassified Arthrobacter TaxID=235627 RepID=UPI001EF0DA69|nr:MULTISPECIES: PLD nuclease N-terminal domain-containing protein [unclassified Arthrobacter]UKA67609.1 PLD nuclease N-terminal domain-containing protein [Arthrobacter sp. FW306-05-C]UKA76306.1 PLD nuclease N-terminal domain-containing protein [Arthrobacter sp. FW306-07-I]